MKTFSSIKLKIGFMFCTLLFLGCSESKKEEDATKDKEIPPIEIASQEYVDLAQKSLDAIADLNLDTWKDYFADDVVWYWPDGNSDTRHTLVGKEALISFWQDWKEKTGGTLAFSNNTFLPIKVNEPTNHYKLVGTAVITYTDMTISMEEKSTSVRQNIVFMFNDDKKITHALLYYDRTGIIELTKIQLGEVN